MASSEGDAIEALVQYLKQHDMRLMTGRKSLRIQPRLLEQAALRIRSLVQLHNASMTTQTSGSNLLGGGQSVNIKWQMSSNRSPWTTTVVQMVTNMIASPHTFNRRRKGNAGEDIGGVKQVLRLEALQRLLSHVRWLRVESALPGLRDPTGLSFAPFSGLRKLELRGCDLSTCAWESLPALQERLQELHVTDTLEALHHLLAPHAVSVSSAAMTEMATWQQLRVLDCSLNCIVDMDPSLALLPALQSLVIAHSNISTVANLQACSQLTSLDLSHNRISTLTGLAMLKSAPLQQLSVVWNSLRSTEGIENLRQLRTLDLGCNFICSVSEAVRMSGLVELQSLQLAGNPLAFALSYRCDVLSAFPQCTSLKLDGATANSHERHRLRKRPTGGRLNQICRPKKPPDETERTQRDRWQQLVDEMLGPLCPPRSTSTSSGERPAPSKAQRSAAAQPPGSTQGEDVISALALGWHGMAAQESAARLSPRSPAVQRDYQDRALCDAASARSGSD